MDPAPIYRAGDIASPFRTGGKNPPPAGNFGSVLQRAFDTVSALQAEKDTAVAELAAGENPDIHGAMIAVQKADLSFRLMLQVRNKALAAYEEIMRMNI